MNIIFGTWRETVRNKHMILAIVFDCEVKVEMGQQVPIIKRIGLDLVGPLRVNAVCVFVPSFLCRSLFDGTQHETASFTLIAKTIADNTTL